MSYFYFQVEGDAGTFDIDTEAINLELPGINRNYQIKELYSDSSHINGTGNFTPGRIKFSKRYKKNGSGIAWNSLRKAVLLWMSVPIYKKLYFYIVDDNTNTYRIQCYPISVSPESYTTYIMSEDNTFEFQCKTAYYENITATTTTNTITGTTLNSFNITNSGILQVPPVFTFTPLNNFSIFQIEIAQGYGFRLSNSFLVGQVIMYDCATSKVYINGTLTAGLQSDGSTFNLAPGVNTIYVYATDGTLETYYNERVL